jgi:hypothetical protein
LRLTVEVTFRREMMGFAMPELMLVKPVTV